MPVTNRIQIVGVCLLNFCFHSLIIHAKAIHTRASMWILILKTDGLLFCVNLTPHLKLPTLNQLLCVYTYIGRFICRIILPYVLFFGVLTVAGNIHNTLNESEVSFSNVTERHTFRHAACSANQLMRLMAIGEQKRGIHWSSACSSV